MLPTEIKENIDVADLQEIWRFTPHTDLEIRHRQTLRSGIKYVLGVTAYPPLNFTSGLLRRCLQGIFFWWMDTRDENLKDAVEELLFSDIELEETE